MKPRYKRRIFWALLSFIAMLGLAIVLVPPFVGLNSMKPQIESAIKQQTNLDAKINGNVSFSLLGRATVVANDISTPMGPIGYVMFSIPLHNIFNPVRAPLTGRIFVYGAQLSVTSLTPPNFDNRIAFKNSVISFMGKDYEITEGVLHNGLLRGTVRTQDYRYEFDSNGDEFHIRNKNNNLDISGNLYSDGSARGTLAIETDEINKWFEFKEPRIDQRLKLVMDFYWDGHYGFKFTNIHGNNLTGEIELFNDGRRDIKLYSDNMDFDLSFLLNGTSLFHNTAFDLEMRGNLLFAGRKFKHVKINALGTHVDDVDIIQIKNITADDLVINGGTITENGAENLRIQMMHDGLPAYCLFSGTPQKWKCAEFFYDGMSGSMSVIDDRFDIFVSSDKKMPDSKYIKNKAKIFGTHGVINFQFSDIGGTVYIDNKKFDSSYKFAKNRTLEWLGVDLYFMPDAMRKAPGDFVWDESGIRFSPYSDRWKLAMDNNFFYISGKSIKELVSNLDLQFMNDFEYIVSGSYKDENISNLEIKIAGHLFKGSTNGKNIKLITDVLDLDTFANQEFIDNYDEAQFLTGEPLLMPFSLGFNISLSAGTLIYDGNDFRNFTYSLRDDMQSFSITDDQRGSLLAGISKENKKYDIIVQLNKFMISGQMLLPKMPINISDTVITGQANLNTYGQIAHDIWYNLSGHFDMSFDGGTISGFGTDDFYANAEYITTLNAENFMARALDGGTSGLKSLQIAGDYDRGNFVTTEPFEMSLRHTDVIGIMQFDDGKLSANMDFVLRGTSPSPRPITVEIMPSGARKYSLSQIMIDFDPDFFRDFVATHDKF